MSAQRQPLISGEARPFPVVRTTTAKACIACVTSQCVAGRRIGSEAEVREETTAWYEDINSIQRVVD